MDEKLFRESLRKSGKKPHVIEGLIQGVRRFEEHLNREGQRTLDSVQTQDILDYAEELESIHAGSARRP